MIPKLTKEQIQEALEQYCDLEYKEISESDLKAMPKHMVDVDDDMFDDLEENEYPTPDFVQNNINMTRLPSAKLKPSLRNCQHCGREVQTPGPEIAVQISSGNRGAYLRERCKTCKMRKNPFNGTWSLPAHEANQCYLVFEQYDITSNAGMVRKFKNMGTENKD